MRKSYGADRLGVRNSPTSAFGQQLNFSSRDGVATIDDVEILETDIPTANGLIHVVDSVILPAEKHLEILEADRMTRLVTLLEASGLNLALADSSKYTILHRPMKRGIKNPTSTLSKIQRATIEKRSLRSSPDMSLPRHVSENPIPYQKLRSIHGAPIYLTVDEERSQIQGIPIEEADTEAFNGLVNVISEVIRDPMELPEQDLSKIDAIKFA